MTTIRLKNSVVASKAPAAVDLVLGEVALNANSASPALYFKDNADNIIKLEPGSGVEPSPTPPVSPSPGDLWYDTGNNTLNYWDGSNWESVSGGVESVNGETGVVVLSLGDLEGVTLAPLSNGDIIAWNGSAWVNTAAPPADISGSSISDLNDVDTTGVDDGDMLYWVKASGEWQSAAPPPGTDLTGYLKTGDNISELVNDAGYLTEADLEDIEGALFFKGSIDATTAYPPSVTTGDVWSNTVTGTARAEWVGITNVVAGDLLARGETEWTIIGASTVPDLSDYIKKGDDVTELTNNAVYLLTTEAAADSEKLDGQDGDYYLNYQNATNTPDLDDLSYVPLGSWSAIPALV